MTLDAAGWNCAGGDLSSCVTDIILLDHVSYYSERVYQLTFFYPFLFYVLIYIYIYVYVFYVLWFACMVSFSTNVYSMH